MIALVREEEVRERVAGVMARRRTEIGGLLPGARIEHVGSTAVPGSLTKGDLDICVIVDRAEFERASRVLAARFEIHQSENWSPTLARRSWPPSWPPDCPRSEPQARAARPIPCWIRRP